LERAQHRAHVKHGSGEEFGTGRIRVAASGKSGALARAFIDCIYRNHPLPARTQTAQKTANTAIFHGIWSL